MKPNVRLEVTAGTLAALTPAQFEALQQNVLAEGRWEQQSEPVRLSGSDPLGVEVGGMFVGIEADGYTHS